MGAEMAIAAYIGVGIVAALHLYFLAMEMFFWDKPFGRRVFGLKADFARASKTLAANQGLYNGFLAAGLIWGLTLGVSGHPIIFFFLGCVIVAGIFGGVTVNRKIILVQALPGAVAMVLLLLS